MKKLLLLNVLTALVFSLNAQLFTPNGVIQGSSGNLNVGIGVSNPANTLHLNSPSSTYLRIDKTSTGFESGLVFGVNGGSDFYIWTDDGSNSLKIEASGLVGEHDGAPRVEFPRTNKNILLGLSGGNVGIGVTSPREKIHVNGNIVMDCIDPRIYTGIGTNELNRYLFLLNSPDHGSASGLKAGGILISDDYSYGNPGKNDMIVKGNILIGKPTQVNSLYRLDVDGKIRANEIVVNTSGADFVFDPSYKLPTLSELEAFIKTHKHLPDIAPAKEMQENGVSAGEMQTKLLQKVEELTLYLIEQNKTIEKQVADINDLKNIVGQQQKEIDNLKSQSR